MSSDIPFELGLHFAGAQNPLDLQNEIVVPIAVPIKYRWLK